MCFAAAAVLTVGSRPSPCSLDKSVASFATLSFPPLCAVQGCMCFAVAAAFVVGSRGPSPCSLDASVASFVTLTFLPLRTAQGCASALLQPLPSPSALVWAVAVLVRRERRQLRYAGASTAVRGAGLRVLCCSLCFFVVGSRPSPCSLA